MYNFPYFAVIPCSATKRSASEYFINSFPGHIWELLFFHVRRLTDPHSLSRRGCRHSQVHKQSEFESSALQFNMWSKKRTALVRPVSLHISWITAKVVKLLTNICFFVKILQIMDTIKGTMTEIYNDLSKSTSGNTIAEVNSGIESDAH